MKILQNSLYGLAIIQYTFIAVSARYQENGPMHHASLAAHHSMQAGKALATSGFDMLGGIGGMGGSPGTQQHVEMSANMPSGASVNFDGSSASASMGTGQHGTNMMSDPFGHAMNMFENIPIIGGLAKQGMNMAKQGMNMATNQLEQGVGMFENVPVVGGLVGGFAKQGINMAKQGMNMLPGNGAHHNQQPTHGQGNMASNPLDHAMNMFENIPIVGGFAKQGMNMAKQGMNMATNQLEQGMSMFENVPVVGGLAKQGMQMAKQGMNMLPLGNGANHHQQLPHLGGHSLAPQFDVGFNVGQQPHHGMQPSLQGGFSTEIHPQHGLSHSANGNGAHGNQPHIDHQTGGPNHHSGNGLPHPTNGNGAHVAIGNHPHSDHQTGASNHPAGTHSPQQHHTAPFGSFLPQVLPSHPSNGHGAHFEMGNHPQSGPNQLGDFLGAMNPGGFAAQVIPQNGLPHPANGAQFGMGNHPHPVDHQTGAPGHQGDFSIAIQPPNGLPHPTNGNGAQFAMGNHQTGGQNHQGGVSAGTHSPQQHHSAPFGLHLPQLPNPLDSFSGGINLGGFSAGFNPHTSNGNGVHFSMGGHPQSGAPNHHGSLSVGMNQGGVSTGVHTPQHSASVGIHSGAQRPRRNTV